MAGRRFLFYSHDSFGLGHLRRTISLARAVAAREPDADILIVTGLALSTSYRLPPHVETLKLPAVRKDEHGEYHALRLQLPFEEIRTLRSDILESTAKAFSPDVLVVDKTPVGLRGELRSTLEWIAPRPDVRAVLGLRDIDDSPNRVRTDWAGGRVRKAIFRYYDSVLVYGPPSSPDALSCMGWDDLGVPVERVGYVGPTQASGPAPGLPLRYILVTAGGGGDGFRILAAFADAIRLRALEMPAVIVAGPLMSPDEVTQLSEMTEGLNVRIAEFRADMESVVAGAAAVVAMAGYNTVFEILSARKPALFVPRVHPREEQLVRAELLAEAGLADVLHPDDLTPASMRTALDRLLERPLLAEGLVDLDGAARAAKLLCLEADAAAEAEPMPARG